MKKAKPGASAPVEKGARKGPAKRGAGRRMTIEKTFAELQNRFAEISDLNSACAVLSWDQAVYMPRAGSIARGRQLATVGRIAHERLVDAEIGRLLDRLEASAAMLDEREAAFVSVARRDFERACRVPPALVGDLAEHANRAYAAWTAARPANDFGGVVTVLEDGIKLSRAFSACFKPKGHVLDPLIDGSDPGMTVASIDALFAKLRTELVPMVATACRSAAIDDTCLRQALSREKQTAFILKIIERIGYDLTRGRLDASPHPFSITFSHDDVRITTRYRDNEFAESFYSALHEAGHALYEQGVDPAYDRTPLAGGISAGVHESQSRLWENIVGRGESFLQFVYPLLQKEAPGFRRVPFRTFHRAINRVTPSLIRTDADELTYTLHILIRFDLERRMLEGTLSPADLPAAWSEAYENALGVTPAGAQDGCLQDVHWFSGLIGGAFQGYAIGNILASQLYDAAVAAHPGIETDVAKGRFALLHGWLATNVHRHGRRHLPHELIEAATGKPLSVKPYIGYLREKYSALDVL